MSSFEAVRANMEAYFPWLVKHMVVYKVDTFHPFEVIVTLDDGGVYLYDDIDKTIRKLPPSDQTMTRVETVSEFGKRLQNLMCRKGVTQSDLSFATGIAQPTLSGYINGKNEPGLYAIDKIAKALCCSVDEFRYI